MSIAVPRTPLSQVGRCFVHPVFDYLLVGGGLSLIVVPAVYSLSDGAAMMDFSMLPWFILCANSAHFAASTIRLYTKKGTRDDLPFVTMVLPIVTIAVLTFCMLEADRIGRYAQVVYLTWSPFHYSAQAYGLAVMYCFRSGCPLTLLQKRLLWWITLLPFFKVLLLTLSKHVLAWHLPDRLLWTDDAWRQQLEFASQAVGIPALLLPAALFVYVRQASERPVPLISLLVVLTNAVWFVLFPFLEGFVWTTIFHGVQYLAIVMIFHVRERVAEPGNHRGRLYHAAWFYGTSLVLGYALFNCLPYGYQMLGFGAAQSVLLVIAAINIHHFIVDAYIWKLGRRDGNRRIVESA